MMKGHAVIKGIIFDKDGTLFDFNATWGAWTRGMLKGEAGHDPALFARLADVLGYDVPAATFRPESLVIASTAGEVAEVIRSVLPDLDADALLSRMNAAAAAVTQVEAVPLQSYFAGLRELGLRLGIATNDAEAPARAHLARAGVTQHFDFIAGYDSGHGGKPAPGQLLAFCAETGLGAENCLMVGDSTHDLHAGRAAGMRTIGVLTGPAPREELSPLADVVLSSIGDIPGWLQSEKLLAE
ncbi:phosphoglycolate phosphatase [Yoonia rosea]|uniref:phosphoglycolate phosphatase n=1 Tax=Yoonia rosea TaxID=287098 RepID=A0A1R3X0Z6_9RHOB|nr:HAD family hydrolase [Yoonia rosea]SIT83508.1 phosphoglycolate phosphatase [Yoonia rosea]